METECKKKNDVEYFTPSMRDVLVRIQILTINKLGEVTFESIRGITAQDEVTENSVNVTEKTSLVRSISARILVGVGSYVCNTRIQIQQ